MLSYKVDLFVQLGLIFQSTGFVFFNTLLIFFIVKAEEKLQYELRCCHDRGYYECSEKYPVFCGKALYYIRHKIRRIENDRRKLSANGRTKRNVQRVYTVDKSRLELTGQPKSIFYNVRYEKICKAVMRTLEYCADYEDEKQRSEAH